MPAGVGVSSSSRSLVENFSSLNSHLESTPISRDHADQTDKPAGNVIVLDVVEKKDSLIALEESNADDTEASNSDRNSNMPIENLDNLYDCPLSDTNMNIMDVAEDMRSRLITKIKRFPRSPPQQDFYENDAIEESDEEDDNYDEDNAKEQMSQLRRLYPKGGNPGNKRLLRTISRQSDDDGDGEYSQDERELKKTIMVGSEFQAVIPEGLKKYDDVLPYENEDKLLWDPNRMNGEQIEKYLYQIKNVNKKDGTFGVEIVPCGIHLRDDEQALYLLQQCGHNTDEAIRRKSLNSVLITERMSSWSEEECRNFESGIRVHGKDFYTIKHTKVKTRSVGELVQFYYLWKKTERHDVFANKARLDKKKYNLHPGLTDYMDRFIDEQDSNGNGGSNQMVRDRSSSPGVINYALQSDIKRKAPTASTSGNQKTVTIPTDQTANNDTDVSSGSSNKAFPTNRVCNLSMSINKTETSEVIKRTI